MDVNGCSKYAALKHVKCTQVLLFMQLVVCVTASLTIRQHGGHWEGDNRVSNDHGILLTLTLITQQQTQICNIRFFISADTVIHINKLINIG